MTKHNETQRKHIAEVLVACGGDLVAAHQHLRKGKGNPPSLVTLCKWLEKNTHNFRATLGQVRQRAQRFEYCKAIAVAERMVRSIRHRVKLWRNEHKKCLQQEEQKAEANNPDKETSSKAAEINSALIKLETHLRQTTEYLLCLKHPKERDAVEKAVVGFAHMLLNHVAPEQREAIAAVARKLLPEGVD